MKKIVFGTLAVFAAIGLNAAVLATVNGQDITDEDVSLLLRQMPGVNYESLQQEHKQQLLNQAIDRKLLMNKAISSGIEKDKDYIDTLGKVKNEIALEIWMKKEYDKARAEDAAVKKFYDDNADRFIQPEQVKASHILVEKEADAKSIVKELSGVASKDLAAKFADLAKQKSVDGSAQSGGDLGFFNKNQMVKPFSDAAFSLKKGEITKTPVKTQFGYHIIYLEDKQPEKKASFDEVKEQIVSMLKADEFKKNVESQIKTLRDKAKIDIKK